MALKLTEKELQSLAPQIQTRLAKLYAGDVSCDSLTSTTMEFLTSLITGGVKKQVLLDDLRDILAEATDGFVNWLWDEVAHKFRSVQSQQHGNSSKRLFSRAFGTAVTSASQAPTRDPLDESPINEARSSSKRALREDREPARRSAPIVLKDTTRSKALVSRAERFGTTAANDSSRRNIRDRLSGKPLGRERDREREGERGERRRGGVNDKLKITIKQNLEEPPQAAPGILEEGAEAEEEQLAPKPTGDTSFTITLGGNQPATKRRRTHGGSVATATASEESALFKDTRTVAAPADKKARCSFFPNCSKGAACPYFHPTEPCSKFPACPFGKKCRYLHPSVVCKFGHNCTRPKCNFTHPTPAETPCRFGTKCNRIDKGCPYLHVQESGEWCTDGFACKDRKGGKCPNKHPPAACRFGALCRNKDKGCSFSHGEICEFGNQCTIPLCTKAHSALTTKNTAGTPTHNLSFTLPHTPPRDEGETEAETVGALANEDKEVEQEAMEMDE